MMGTETTGDVSGHQAARVRSRLTRRGVLGLMAVVPGAVALAAACGDTAGSKPAASRQNGATRPLPNTAPAAAAPTTTAAAARLAGKLMPVPYDAALPPLGAEPVKQIVLTATDDVLVPLGKEVTYPGWGFNGTVPGPILRVRQGDTIEATLVNKGTQGHSIDFHAAQTPWDRDFKTILPGQSYTFRFTANYPGCFMYHCGTPPVLHHIANGMYGAIIVDPQDGWPTPAASAYVLVQSEFYVTAGKADAAKMAAVQPDYLAFNGVPNQYADHPLTAKPGERVRLYVVNAGPSVFSGFHVVGTIFEAVYSNGNPANRLVGVQTHTVAPGEGSVFDLVMPEAGTYPIVTHAFAYASKGAVGMLKVG